MNTPVKFLLVDDLPENLLSLEALLRRPDLELVKARSGDEALELCLHHDFALALIDVQMPGLNGFELAELMRGNERTKRIPIIFVTAGAHSSSGAFKAMRSAPSTSSRSRSKPISFAARRMFFWKSTANARRSPSSGIYCNPRLRLYSLPTSARISSLPYLLMNSATRSPLCKAAFRS